MKDKNCVDPINIYRTIAVACVFALHTSIFSGYVYNEKSWFLKTPAWSAVWLFYLLSGYLIGKGFYTNRYKQDGKYTLKSVLKFYYGRLIKVGLPTWIFSILSICILDPNFLLNNKQVIIKILTFTYFNNPSSNIIGATWYVSTLMWLYLFAPILIFLLEKIVNILTKFNHSQIYIMVLFIVVVCIGMMNRLYQIKRGGDWSSSVYVPFYCNLDIYICGMILNFFRKIKSRNKVKNLKVFGIFMLIFLIFVNARIYYLGAYDGIYMFVYQYIFPSVCIIIGGFYLYIFGENKMVNYVPLSMKNIIRNPIRLIDLFAVISFEFYLVHSLVLNSIYTYIQATSPFRFHLKLMGLAFVISSLLAFVMNCANEKINRLLLRK